MVAGNDNAELCAMEPRNAYGKLDTHTRVLLQRWGITPMHFDENKLSSFRNSIRDSFQAAGS